MAINIREGIWGLEHLRLAFCRRLFKMKPDSFMERYARTSARVEICLDTNGNQILCERCGFVIMKAGFENGWKMEMCSALPLVAIDNPKFQTWLTTLAKPAKTSGTDNSFEPILVSGDKGAGAQQSDEPCEAN